jgi:signal transduction histidine kinase
MEDGAVRVAFFKRSVLFGLASLFACSIFALAAYFQLRQQRLPYHDSFVKEKADEWQAFGGTWELNEGAMRNESDERGAKLLTGSSKWRDYSLEADVQLLGHDGDAGLIARATDEEEGVDSYSGYYAGLRNRDNALVVGRADHGWTGEQTAPLTGGVHPFLWYHLKIVTVGCNFAALVSGPRLALPAASTMIRKDCPRSGRIGLRSYSSGGIWRNVHASAAEYSDFQKIESEVANLSARALAASSPNGQPEDGAKISTQDRDRDHRPSVTQPISSLRLVPSSNSTNASIRGVVVLTSPVLFVEDTTGGVAIPNPDAPPLKVGDEVEATGIPQPKDFSSVLQNAKVRLLWAGTPIPPVSVTASQAATGAFDATFVEVEGHLIGKETGPANTVILQLQQGEQAFRALMGPGRADLLLRKLKLNSLLRLRGIAVVDSKYTENLTPFVMLLPSTDNVDVLAGPPWWSTGHLVAIAVSALILALVVQVFYGRVERWRLRAVLDERQRLAHEMHDTIAQSFAGIGFQLQAIRNDLREKNPAVHRQLDLACDLVRHSHEEARRSIATLRPESLESIGLLPALEQCARRLVNGGSVDIKTSIFGDERPMPIRVSDTLFRIGQEAIANAVRHAAPASLSISLSYVRDSVCLIVEDDGVGFCNTGDLLGFGLRGMRKRADTIAAKFNIVSSPNSGTRVEVASPLPPRFSLSNWPVQIWRNLQERHFHA